MKKIILILLACLSLYTVFNTSKEKETVKIPDSAIRFRILANSNSPRDQKIKEDIKNKLQEELYFLLQNTKNIDSARNIINSNMNNFNEILELNMKNVNYSYSIDYGMHDFPEKKYKGKTYPSGKYESLLVTLGKGEGDNWWCVLFPPMCLMEAEEKDIEEVEYNFFLKDFFKNILKVFE